MFNGVGPSCRSISSKSAARYNSFAVNTREWLKPFAPTGSNPPSSTRLHPREAPRSSSSDEVQSSTTKPVNYFRAQNRSNTVASTSLDSEPGRADFLQSLRQQGKVFKPRPAESSERGVGKVLPDSTRQSAWYGGQDRGKFGQESRLPTAWKSGADSRRGPEDSRRHHKSEPLLHHERTRKPFQPRRESNRDTGTSRNSDLPPAHDYHQRSSSGDKTRPYVRSGHEQTRHPRRPLDGVDELTGLIQKAGFTKSRTRSELPGEVPEIRPEDVVAYFESNVSSWALRDGNVKRIVSFGVPEVQARILLKRFIRDTKAGILSSNTLFYGLDRFGHPHQEDSIDIIYSTIFFSWAARQDNLTGVNTDVLAHIQRLVETASQPFPADSYQLARRFRRKIIIHIGPTNSGKTHHALRALAAADTGVYAGPLRLLAYEIFQRLNSGSIVPLGIEQDPAVPTGPNPAYARACNLITGDEVRIMSDLSKLASCTVEMLNTDVRYDVAVVDEIQMIGDLDRGSSWTQAVLGLCAKEVHLCGEETAVPVVEALLAHTGDEIEIRRYNRLTPLTVDDNVLHGDLSKIQKGDCVVAFSRTSIFALKKAVEKATNMRCAVVYGGLPPETRAEQAALFNDPNSGYDILIGSDAIGMGLNLKIKRVIFSTTSKFDGKDSVPLPVSSVKQIAGRAGRFGLHKDDLGGTTTTLFEEDLPHLKYCLAQPYKPMQYGWTNLAEDQVHNLFSVLPASNGGSLKQAVVAGRYIGRLPSYLRQASSQVGLHADEFMNRHWSEMPIADKISLCFAPIPWRNVPTVEMVTSLLNQHRDRGSVDLFETMEQFGLIKMLEGAERMIAQHSGAAAAPGDSKDDTATPAADPPASSDEAPGPPSAPVPAPAGKAKIGPGLAQRQMMMANFLARLESFHKVLVVYKWFSLRQPIIYAGSVEVGETKLRVEAAMNGLLMVMSSHLSARVGLKGLVQGKGEKAAGLVGDSDEYVTKSPQMLE